jgi:hypothetical protein
MANGVKNKYLNDMNSIKPIHMTSIISCNAIYGKIESVFRDDCSKREITLPISIAVNQQACEHPITLFDVVFRDVDHESSISNVTNMLIILFSRMLKKDIYVNEEAARFYNEQISPNERLLSQQLLFTCYQIPYTVKTENVNDVTCFIDHFPFKINDIESATNRDCINSIIKNILAHVTRCEDNASTKNDYDVTLPSADVINGQGIHQAHLGFIYTLYVYKDGIVMNNKHMFSVTLEVDCMYRANTGTLKIRFINMKHVDGKLLDRVRKENVVTLEEIISSFGNQTILPETEITKIYEKLAMFIKQPTDVPKTYEISNDDFTK